MRRGCRRWSTRAMARQAAYPSAESKARCTAATDVFAYGLGEVQGWDCRPHGRVCSMRWPRWTCRLTATAARGQGAEALAAFRRDRRCRDHLGFDIDVVFRVNRDWPEQQLRDQRAALGVAHRFPAEDATKVLAIEVQVGRAGAITQWPGWNRCSWVV